MHLMVDLETYGTYPGCAIRSIGACTFRLEEFQSVDQFYENVTDASNLDCGLTVDPKTKEWWGSQDQQVQDLLLEDQKPLSAVLQSFTRFWAHTGAKYIWSHGAAFDVPILQVAYKACGLTVPWDYHDIRDTRTVFHLFGDSGYEKPNATKHYALDDAIVQAMQIQRSLEQSRSQLPGLSRKADNDQT